MSTETPEEALAYFESQPPHIDEFWRRMGGIPALTTVDVLDLGCGHGAMSVAMARAGARSVLGVDLDAFRVDFCNRLVAERFPDLADRVTFRAVDACALPGESFDAIVSKNTFEHIEDVPGTLEALHWLLRPGGRLYAGFSPLYHSPFGDHRRTGLRVPWAHTLLPDRVVLAAASRHNRRPVRHLHDIGLNGWTGQDFLDAFDASPFTVRQLRINPGGRRLMPVLTWLRRTRVLNKYATVGIYAVLER